MGTTELILIAVALSMDAFAAALCKGLSMRQVRRKDALVIAGFFGGFQALMPLVGWYAGLRFESSIAAVDHWIAFGLLALIGGQPSWHSFQGQSRTGRRFDTDPHRHKDPAGAPGLSQLK